MSALRGLALSAALVVVAACSVVQLGYGQLDRVVYWYVDDYLPLSAEQGAALRPRVARLVRWHCSTQLPAYTKWLRAVQDDVLARAGPQQLDRRADEVFGFLRDIAAAAAPEAAHLLAQATPQQIAALFAGLEERNREFREEWVDAPPPQVARKREKRMRARIEGWIGTFNAAQDQALLRWSRSQEPTGAAWYESRLAWQAALRRALERRAAGTDFGTEVHILFTRPETYWTAEYRRLAAANRQRTMEFLAAVAAALDDTQRARLDGEVRSVAADFDKLACAGAAPASGTAPGVPVPG